MSRLSPDGLDGCGIFVWRRWCFCDEPL